MIVYCSNCLLPRNKPDLYLNEAGKCAACVSFDERPSIDWSTRRTEFENLVREIKSKNTSNWDCIVPVSGGKDSTAQVLHALKYGLKPLCVTSTTCDLTPVGRDNIDNIKNFGVDYIEVSPNMQVRSRLNKLCLEQVGDISWPEHVGIFTIPVRMAVEFRVPLILWGENSQNEYGGPLLASQKNNLDRRWLEEFGGLLGLRTSDLLDTYGFSQQDLNLYSYPSTQEIEQLGLKGIFLGHYFKWDGLTNFLISQANGFKTHSSLVEGSIVSFENIDNYQTGIHDYFKFLKFGFGRATDIASLYIRRNLITREQGLGLVKKFDGKYPNSYLGKPLDQILARINLSIEEFDKICDRFTNFDLFEKDSNGRLTRDISNSLVKTNYDNIS